MAQAHAITVFDQPEALGEQLSATDSLGKDIVALTKLGGGVMRFAGTVFPDTAIDTIYAQKNERESLGRGPHFDIYNEGISPDYPWLDIYNLAGTCAVSATEMPEKLAEEYARLYPEPNADARDARRHFGAIVLQSKLSDVYTGTIEPDMGLILPQAKAGPHIIHEVVPEDMDYPGSFIKLVVPKRGKAVLKQLDENGFAPLDELLTKGISDQEEADKLESPSLPPRRRKRPQRRSGRGDSQPRGLDGSKLLD